LFRPPVWIYAIFPLTYCTDVTKNVPKSLRLIPLVFACIRYTVGVKSPLSILEHTFGLTIHLDSRLLSEKVAGLQRRFSNSLFVNLVTLQRTAQVRFPEEKFNWLARLRATLE
jgi:hypothetical protein